MGNVREQLNRLRKARGSLGILDRSRSMDSQPSPQRAAGFANIGCLRKGCRGDVGEHFVPDAFFAVSFKLILNNMLFPFPFGTGNNQAAVRVGAAEPEDLR